MRGVERIIRKHLVCNQCPAPLPAETREALEFLLAEVRACRIVGRHHQHGANIVRRCRDRINVDRPATVVLQRVRVRTNTFERGEMLEQGIARSRDKDTFTRVAQQLEQPAVRLTAAGRQYDVCRIDAGAAAALIGGDGVPSRRKAEGVRFVPQRLGGSERREQAVGIWDRRARRIRFGEIGNRRPVGAKRDDRSRQGVRPGVRRQAS